MAEKRLIDADEFAKTLEKTDANVCADYGDGFCEFGYSRSLLRLLLSEAPTVDAVEVVRCRDCRFCRKHPTSDKVKLCTNENWNTEYHPFVNDNDFCSYGERRTDG